MEITRELATLRTIVALTPIENADAIELATVGGWNVVVKKGEYKVGDLALYFEVDSFLPAGNPDWQFLVDKSCRSYNGRTGHVLRTIRLRGVYSQGLLLPCPRAAGWLAEFVDGEDWTEYLQIEKYEKPLAASLAGTARGNFPQFIPKTDQMRVENAGRRFDSFQSQTWEVTEKLEGSSVTVYKNADVVGVCSRNLDLIETEGNTFWNTARTIGLVDKLNTPEFGNIAVQGELVGPGVQENIYQLAKHDIYVFDVYNIDERRYLTPAERYVIVEKLGIKHAPIIKHIMPLYSLATDGNVQIADIVNAADGASEIGCKPKREGIVFKSLTSQDSFKAISRAYLAKQKD